MFTAKAKRNYKTAILFTVVVLLTILIVAVLWPSKPEEQTEPDLQPGVMASQNPSLWTDEEPEASGEDTEEETEEEDFAEKNNITADGPSYYEVKRAGGQIAVFFCDGRGNMVQLETTEILYDLLSPQDQQLFDQGIRVDGQEELSMLLQDFEG